jgi:sugar (pentulose or hexulose) kinase
MDVLAIDVGSSSVKMGVLRGRRLVGRAVRRAFPTRYDGSRAEVDAEQIINAIARASRELGALRSRIDCIALATMSPSWVAIDARGRAITPVVTHQDRRSVEIARLIEKRVGKKRYLHLAGSLPVPGGISSTTCAWFLRHQRPLMHRAELVGHVQTLLHRQFCGTRIADPSHASFMGIYSTLKLSGWNDELCDAVGVPRKLLPDVRDANEVGGTLLPDAARLLGLRSGTPMLVGMIDTGAAMLLAGAKVGQLVNVVGSTDVLALCTDQPRPREGLLTRALGTGRRWIAAGTIAAAGSSLTWAHQQLFPDRSEKQFHRLVARCRSSGSVEFEPYLAGARAAVEQRRGTFRGLTLSSTREQMLASIVDALARASAQRIELLESTGTALNRRVMISGGAGTLADLMHRDWRGRWRFWTEPEATLRGLSVLASSI